MKTKWPTLILTVACAATLMPPDLFAQSSRSKKGAPVTSAKGAQGNPSKSPMPPRDFEPQPEALGLVRPRKTAYDAALAETCRRYAQSDARARAAMRRALDEEDLSILNGFAAGAAVFGLRERSAEWLAAGLTALAMIEQDRFPDERDLIVSLGLLHHSAKRIGASPEKLFREAAALAERKTARLILQYLTRPEEIKELREATGYAEVETEAGLGFIASERGKYDPTYDLSKIVVEVAELFAAEKYLVTPSVAQDLPRVWLVTNDNAALDRALAKARAGASVYGDLVTGPPPGRISQTLIVFIVELEDESSVSALLDAARRKRPREGLSMLALAEGRLFCLLTSQPSDYDFKSLETNESLQRYTGRLAAIFRRHVKR